MGLFSKSITISKNHNLPPEVIKERISALGDKMKAKFNADPQWSSDGRTLNVKGPGVTATLEIKPNSVDVKVDGPAVLVAGGQIKSNIETELDNIIKQA